MKKIYLDYAATSPVKKIALKAMLPFMSDHFGNASSIHSFGREARFALSEAREKVARFFNVLPEEIIFTSGGSESDNLALRGIINYQLAISNEKPHIITTTIEHHAVLHTVEDLEKRGLVEVTYVKPQKNGIVKVEDVISAIKENTILISVMYANNEIGTIQPIVEIAAAVKDMGYRIKDIGEQKQYPISDIRYPAFHTDAVQAVEYLDCDVQNLGVDLFSFSGHKFGAPKGIGGLIVRKGIKLASQITGGEQEYHRRAGTENVAAIAGLAAAIAEVAISKEQGASGTEKLRDYFINRIEKEIPKVTLNGDREKRLPNNINFSFQGIEGEGIVLGLDEAGIAASTGSACASKSLEPSAVIMAISGGDHERAHSAIRFTLGDVTSKEEIDYTIEKLKIIVKRLRKMSPFWKG